MPRFTVTTIASHICGGNLTTIRYSPDRDDDDFPDIDELLSGMKQKNNSASADPNSHDNNDDDEFPDINELLSGIKQKSVQASAKPNHGSMAGKVDNGSRGGSPHSSRSKEKSTQSKHTKFLALARTSYSYDPRSNYTER